MVAAVLVAFGATSVAGLAAPAAARHPALASSTGRTAVVPFQVRIGRALGPQPYRPLIAPARKPEPQPAASAPPDLFSNPLKRRHMAMPATPGDAVDEDVLGF